MTRHAIGLVALFAALVFAPPLLAQSSESYRISEEVRRGSNAYLGRDFPAAIRAYAKAIELNRAHPTLDRNTWRVVVDNLGMSYGLSGDNRQARATFEYGISEDETYPMFHYNLACSLAERNDLDGALVELRSAYKYKANMIPGERLPNPATDSSFARFGQNARFRRTLAELGWK